MASGGRRKKKMRRKKKTLLLVRSIYSTQINRYGRGKSNIYFLAAKEEKILLQINNVRAFVLGILPIYSAIILNNILT